LQQLEKYLEETLNVLLSNYPVGNCDRKEVAQMKEIKRKIKVKKKELEKKGFIATAQKDKHDCLVCTGCSSCTDGGGGGDGNGS